MCCLSTTIVDADGVVRATFDGEGTDLAAGGKSILKATGTLKDAHFWSPDDPYLYNVYTTLTVGGKVVDVRKTTTGFRKTAFLGGAGKGGVYINDQFVFLKGFAQRSANDWAGVGGAYPDWMHDFTAKLIRDDHANYVRWMHVTPQPVDAASFDRFGIVQVVPAGDKETDPTGRQWDQRVEAMRIRHDLFPQQPQQSLLGVRQHRRHRRPDAADGRLRKKWDPNGGRVLGCRIRHAAITATPSRILRRHDRPGSRPSCSATPSSAL